MNIIYLLPNVGPTVFIYHIFKWKEIAKQYFLIYKNFIRKYCSECLKLSLYKSPKNHNSFKYDVSDTKDYSTTKYGQKNTHILYHLLYKSGVKRDLHRFISS